MRKQNLLRSAALAAAVLCLFLFAACDDDPTNGGTESTSSQTTARTEKDPVVSDSSPAETEAKTEPSPASSEAPDGTVVKITGGADEVGIYSIVVRLTDQAADKGVIEMVYHGAKGSPQENSIVNTFRIEYEKEEAGTYEIRTFFDGEVNQNQHPKDEMKVANTFGAALRAGDVIISYTPDGGEPREIFRADAAYFYAPTN